MVDTEITKLLPDNLERQIFLKVNSSIMENIINLLKDIREAIDYMHNTGDISVQSRDVLAGSLDDVIELASEGEDQKDANVSEREKNAVYVMDFLSDKNLYESGGIVSIGIDDLCDLFIQFKSSSK